MTAADIQDYRELASAAVVVLAFALGYIGGYLQ